MDSDSPAVVGTHGVFVIGYEQTWGPGAVPQHVFTALDAGVIVGTLIVNGEQSDWRGSLELPPWTIFNVSVRSTHRRRGIATALLAEARRCLPEVRHSPYRNADGRAWAAADPEGC